MSQSRRPNIIYIMTDDMGYGQEEYLFDLLSGPGEKKDLKATQAAIFQRLKRKHAEWEQTVLKPIPL